MQQFRRVIVLLLLLLPTASLAQESADREKEFRKALENTPFENVEYREGDAIPEVPGRQESSNMDRFIQVAERCGLSYVALIEQYSLWKELQISEEQMSKLRAVVRPSPSHIQRQLNPRAFDLDSKAFSKFLATFKSTADTAYAESDAQVEAILSPKQMKRLRQIGFQHYLYFYISPVNAFRVHQLELSDQHKEMLNHELAQHRFEAKGAEDLLGLLSKLEAVEYVTKKKHRAKLGKIVPISGKASDTVLEILEANSVQPQTENPRRGQK